MGDSASRAPSPAGRPAGRSPEPRGVWGQSQLPPGAGVGSVPAAASVADATTGRPAPWLPSNLPTLRQRPAAFSAPCHGGFLESPLPALGRIVLGLLRDHGAGRRPLPCRPPTGEPPGTTQAVTPHPARPSLGPGRPVPPRASKAAPPGDARGRGETRLKGGGIMHTFTHTHVIHAHTHAHAQTHTHMHGQLSRNRLTGQWVPAGQGTPWHPGDPLGP